MGMKIKCTDSHFYRKIQDKVNFLKKDEEPRYLYKSPVKAKKTPSPQSTSAAYPGIVEIVFLLLTFACVTAY